MRWWDRSAWIAVTAGVAAVYAWTLAPSVMYIDAGELAAVATLLGVAHPTGYPLFTLLGHLVTLLPFGPEPILKLNLMAALLSAGGVGATFAAFRLLVRQEGGAASPGRSLGAGASTAAAAAGALMFAFNRTTWAQALAVEVYSLHILFLGLILLAVSHARSAHLDGDSARQDRLWIVVGFLTGLSFTNHMTTVLLVPGIVLAFFQSAGFRARSVRTVAASLIAGTAGLSLYAVLPLVAARPPLFNWGNVTSFERLLWHVTGKQYRVWIFESGEAALRKLELFVLSLPEQTGYVGLAAALAGGVLLWHANRRLALLTATFLLTCVLYAINYNIQDIEPYYLLAYLMLAFWASWACRQGLVWARRNWSGGVSGVSVLVVVGALTVLVLNYADTHQRGNYMVEDYAANLLDPLPRNSLVFSYQWDYWLAASYYYQYVRSHRPDVAVVDKELLRRSWYLTELERRIPWLIERSRVEVEAFRRELMKFEHGLPYNPAVIQGRFVGMIRSMIRNASDRPVFVTPEIEPEFTEGFVRVPEGLAFRLRTDSGFFATPAPVFRFRDFERDGRYEATIRALYRGALESRARYYRLFGREEAAAEAEVEAGRFVYRGGG